MQSRKSSVFRRAIALAVLTPLLFGMFGAPTNASTGYPRPGLPFCDVFDMKQHTYDGVIEKPQIKTYDDKGNLVSASASLYVVLYAQVVVCVEVDAEAEVHINLIDVLDEDGNGKKDTILVKVDVVAKADVNVKVIAKIKGKLSLSLYASVFVAAQADLNLKLLSGEKKSYYCKGKDGVDTW